ncbi:unnamed protein product, partial [Rotaria sp. Silwood2]
MNLMFYIHIALTFTFISYSTSIMINFNNHENLFELSNENLTVQFNLSNGQIISFNYKSQLITITNETNYIFINNFLIDCSKLINF